jgi:hypothetical protein
VFEGEIDDRQDDADGEDPFRDIEADQLRRRNLGGPFVEDEQVDRRKRIDTVYSAR